MGLLGLEPYEVSWDFGFEGIEFLMFGDGLWTVMIEDKILFFSGLELAN